MTITINTLENINTIANILMNNEEADVARQEAESLAEFWLCGKWHKDDLNEVKKMAKA